MSWEAFLAEGEKAVQIVAKGLRKRNINAGSTIKTRFDTDEDIPVYDREKNKLFWISIKSVSGAIKDPIGQMPPNYKGWCVARSKVNNG